MNRPIRCRTTGRRIGTCACLRCTPLPRQFCINAADAVVMAVERERYLADENGTKTSIAEVQAQAYRLGAERAQRDSGIQEIRNLLVRINAAHSSGLPKSMREQISAVCN